MFHHCMFSQQWIKLSDQIRSVTQSCPTLQPYESQHARPPCPSPTPWVYPNSCPSGRWCHPAISSSSSPSPPVSIPSQHQSLFQWISSSHKPKYWSFSFSISPSKEHRGLISFRMDWLDLLAVQGTLKSLLQHHNSKASILRCSAVFTVQLSHLSNITKIKSYFRYI